ncbi:MAG: hypothetical protein ABI743_11915, partial [bacterium]
MSRLTLCGLVLILGSLAGCGGSAEVLAPGGAALTPAPDTLSLAPLELPSGAETLVGGYEVSIDPTTMESTVARVLPRHGQSQPPQALTYDLDIDRFLTADGFRIVGLETVTDGDLKITFTHAHPFKAPNFAAGITAANRADLGYTGRLIIYANSRTDSFFSDTLHLDADYVRDPAGFVQVGTLMAHDTGANNVFPFILLADESLNNRQGVSNSGSMTGNYDPANVGWYRGNAGADGAGWTGYDYIHGGQTIRNSFTLNKASLGSGPVKFQLGVLIKYTDPRGVGGKTMRFPPVAPSAADFAYRLPFAALDGSKVDVPSDFRLSVEPSATTHLDVYVRDWDAGATEAASSNLSGEGNVQLVPPGTAGIGQLYLDLPSAFGAPQQLFGIGGSGLPTDRLHFALDLAPDLTPPSGPATALVAYWDPEEAIDDSGYHYGV